MLAGIIDYPSLLLGIAVGVSFCAMVPMPKVPGIMIAVYVTVLAGVLSMGVF